MMPRSPLGLKVSPLCMLTRGAQRGWARAVHLYFRVTFTCCCYQEYWGQEEEEVQEKTEEGHR
jgi:hypothetical protein